MSLERLAYLDHAFNTHGLSLGRAEADEISRLEARFRRGDSLRRLAQFCARPLSAVQAQVLLAIAQAAVAKTFRLPEVAVETRNLDLPGLGPTAVRIALRGRSPEAALRIESGGLERAAGYFLCGVSPARPDEIALMGWSDRAAVLGAPKVRLLRGGPEVHVVAVSEMRSFD